MKNCQSDELILCLENDSEFYKAWLSIGRNLEKNWSQYAIYRRIEPLVDKGAKKERLNRNDGMFFGPICRITTIDHFTLKLINRSEEHGIVLP